MFRCWSEEPAERPTFADLVHHFASNSEYDNVKNLIQSVSNEQTTVIDVSSGTLTSDV